MPISVANTSSSLSTKTIVTAEGADTVTGLKTFDRDPSAPFAVTAASAAVTNLDADKVDGKHSTDLMLLDGTQAMTAALPLGTVGQITFPAAQNAAAGANVLDDYEEGTFTPKIVGTTSGEATYSSQVGMYVKVGQLVIASYNVVLATTGTVVGSVRLSNLPFTINNVGSYVPVSNCYWGTMGASFVNVINLGIAGQSYGDFYGATAAAASVSPMTAAQIAAGTNLVGTIIYRATA